MSCNNLIYEWKIPTISADKKKLLCRGYVRRNYLKYITNAIIMLLAEFYTNDVYTLNEIKNAEPLQLFKSPIVSIYSYKWYLALFPNGSSFKSQKSIMLFLTLIAFPIKLKKISIKYKMLLIETNTQCIKKKIFERNTPTYSGWKCGILKLKDIQNLNQLTFKLEIEILSVHDTDNKLMNISTLQRRYNMRYPEPMELSVSTYKWNISDMDSIHKIKNALNGELFVSPIFAIGIFKFSLKLYPNSDEQQNAGNTNLYLRLLSIPPTIYQLSVYFTLCLKETGTLIRSASTFDEDHLCKGWMDGTLKTVKLMDLNEMTWSVDIVILDLYDKDSNIIHLDDQILYDRTAMSIQLPSTKAIYEWKICDKSMINKIKNAPNVFGFYSPIFDAYSLKWWLDFSPNGSRLTRNGTCNVFLNLASFISATITYVIQFDLSFVESGRTYTMQHAFTTNWYCDGETSWPLTTVDIVDLNTFTFRVEIQLIDVYEKDNIITDRYIDANYEYMATKVIDIKQEYITWNIMENMLDEFKDIQNGEGIKSDIFILYSMQFNLVIFPDGKELNDKGSVVICIFLNDYPLGLNGIISMRYCLFVKETNTRFVGSAIFTKEKNFASWGTERIFNDTFKRLNQCSITLMLELIDIYDDGINLSDEFIFQSDEDQLKVWLYNEVKLGQYYEIFMENGIDSLSMLKLLTINELNNMNIHRISHITQILLCSATLK